MWYQWYFQTERGRAGLEANRRDIARLLWRLWSPNWEFDDATFENLGDAGMWVARGAVPPVGCDRLDDLSGALEAENVELNVVESLVPLKGVWATTLHASGLRLRGAKGWDQNWP